LGKEIIDVVRWVFLPLCGFVQQIGQVRLQKAQAWTPLRSATYLSVMLFINILTLWSIHLWLI